MKLIEIYKELIDDLHVIEKELHQTIDTPHLVMKEASEHLLNAGGKRIRPVFVLLSGKFGEYNIDNLKYVAVALELIHMATLVHDDVIDNAETRRGKLTVKSKWDNRVAMYTGDYIVAKALYYITSSPQPRVHQILSKSIVEICIGEIEQIKALFHWNQSLRTYLLRIKRKTALLMAISCQLGGLACHASEEAVQALYRFGYYVGMAFQITDDVLDFTGTEKQLGKPAGSDLLQGNVTLPVLASFHDPMIKEKIIREFDDGQPNMAYIIKLVKASGGIGYAKQMAHQYLDKARRSLSGIHNSNNMDTLLQITDFIEERSY